MDNSSRHSFKSKGNKEQYSHEEKVAGHIDHTLDALQLGKLDNVRAALEGKTLCASRLKRIVLADLHGLDFVTEYKQNPMAEDDSDKIRIKKLFNSVESQRKKKKAERVKKANRLRFDSSRRPASSPRFTNDVFAFPSMSSCLLCGKPSYFSTNCLLRSRTSMVESCVPDLSVQGCVSSHRVCWLKNLQFSALVRGVLLHNYCIPFLLLPPPCFIENNKSALDNADFVVAAIDELLRNRCILEVSSPPYCYIHT